MRRFWVSMGLAMGVGAAVAASDARLPSEVLAALRQAQVPESAVSIVVQEAGSGQNRLILNEAAAMNPASLAKLLTTYAALDLLGSAWSWTTPIWLQGRIVGDVLDGNLVIRGSGDPTLVVEQVWLLLRRIRQLGVVEIRGDIVLDRSAFDVPAGDPGEFDGEPSRPYNVRADALMLNYKSVTYVFTPDVEARRARIAVIPPLAGAEGSLSVALTGGPCGDWRGTLKATLPAQGRVQFAGSYPTSCGERSWHVADPQPHSFSERMLAGLWQEMGGRLTGSVREGPAPKDQPPTFEVQSPPLSSVVRDINKFSNNTMAQQLFFTLAAAGAPERPATVDAARARLREWMQGQVGNVGAQLVIDNGSGLSRDNRISAAVLARVLHNAWRSPVMPELVASLPISGLDGTLKRFRTAPGRAHLKTGSLRDSAGVAGFVLGDSGRRYVVVGLIHHPNANAARPALEALVHWTMTDGMPASR